MAGTRRWLRHAGNSSDSLARDSLVLLGVAAPLGAHASDGNRHRRQPDGRAANLACCARCAAQLSTPTLHVIRAPLRLCVYVPVALYTHAPLLSITALASLYSLCLS